MSTYEEAFEDGQAAALGKIERLLKLTDSQHKSIKQLEAENAKLRELVLGLADCSNTTCDDCVRWDYPSGRCSLVGVLHELGVEVSDA